jgi:exosortase/archaeosortase family protein
LAEPIGWKRGALAAVSIPIAIATNGLRLVATGVISYFFSPRADSGVVHLALGLGFFALAFLAVVLIHRLLRLVPRYESAVQVTP